MRKLSILSCVMVLSLGATALGQGSAADYQRANRLELLTRNKVFDFRIEPHWFDGGDKFWYRANLADGQHKFFIVDAVAGAKTPSTTQPTVSNETSAPTTQTADRPRFRNRRQTGPNSPDGKWTAFVRNGKFFIRSRATNEEFPMSKDGRPGDGYDGNFAWSPDSTNVVAMWTRDGAHRVVYLIQSSP